MKIGVACVLIDKKRCIWLSQRLGEYQRGKYACPGGMVETTDLSDVHAIQREILEETGINADLSRFHKSIESKHYGGKSDVTHWFVLHLKDEVPKNTEPDKHGDWKLYTIEDAKKLPLMISTNDVLSVL